MCLSMGMTRWWLFGLQRYETEIWGPWESGENGHTQRLGLSYATVCCCQCYYYRRLNIVPYIKDIAIAEEARSQSPSSPENILAHHCLQATRQSCRTSERHDIAKHHVLHHLTTALLCRDAPTRPLHGSAYRVDYRALGVTVMHKYGDRPIQDAVHDVQTRSYHTYYIPIIRRPFLWPSTSRPKTTAQKAQVCRAPETPMQSSCFPGHSPDAHTALARKGESRSQRYSVKTDWQQRQMRRSPGTTP